MDKQLTSKIGLTPTPFKIGNIEVQQVVEMQLPLFEAEVFLPDAPPERISAMKPDFSPWALCGETGKLVLALQTYVLRTAKHTILVDTCVGCDKVSTIPEWHMRSDSSWLARLASVGVAPESVDYVFCTHLHGDHIGWNTRLVDGRFVPVFSNARYIFAKKEIEFVQESTQEHRLLAYQQSVLPVLEANQAQLVDTDFALDDEVWLTPAPGHTPGHVAVNIKSAGVEAILVGDAIHSPLQCAHPEWSALPDSDPALASQTRTTLLEDCLADKRLMLTSHFPLPSIGLVTVAENGFGFKFGC